MTSGLIVGVTTPHVNIEERIRIISFLSFHINAWTAHAWVLGAQARSHAPTAFLELQGWRRQNVQ